MLTGSSDEAISAHALYKCGQNSPEQLRKVWPIIIVY